MIIFDLVNRLVFEKRKRLSGKRTKIVVMIVLLSLTKEKSVHVLKSVRFFSIRF